MGPKPGLPAPSAALPVGAGQARSAAGRLACHQRIASDSSLALAMLGDLPADAPQSQYDGLLREAGALGQVLYLEAEAAGLGASGIGCFFDESIRELLGLGDDALQTFYMFTLGPALADPGATDEPAYPEARG
jgi:nitroreductase